MRTKREQELAEAINKTVLECYGRSLNNGWWENASRDTSVPIKIALMHSELSEALEAFRKDLMDDKLPNRKGIEVELADAVIRIFDLAGYMGLDLGGTMMDKLEYNDRRADHKPENRAKKGGKKF